MDRGHSSSTAFDAKMNPAWEDSQPPPGSHGAAAAAAAAAARLNQYGNNDSFGQAAFLYATPENSSGDALSSSSPESSYGSSSASIIAKVKNSVPDKLERRREQNRSSQRAYRERRERQQRELEAQIVRWQHEYQNLLRMFHQQSDELARSGAIIQQLEGSMFRLQHTMRNYSCGCMSRSPQQDQQHLQQAAEVTADHPLFDMDPTLKMQNFYPRMYNEQ